MEADEVDKRDVILFLRGIVDPELGMNIYDLGLIYGIDIDDGHVTVTLTLTRATCPYAGILLESVKRGLLTVENVTKSTLSLVWDPPWDYEHLSDAIKLQCGLLE